MIKHATAFQFKEGVINNKWKRYVYSYKNENYIHLTLFRRTLN